MENASRSAAQASRKRPLLVKPHAAPPKTATTLRLERMLDTKNGSAKKKHLKKRKLHSSTAVPTSCPPSASSSAPSTSLAPLTSSDGFGNSNAVRTNPFGQGPTGNRCVLSSHKPASYVSPFAKARARVQAKNAQKRPSTKSSSTGRRSISPRKSQHNDVGTSLALNKSPNFVPTSTSQHKVVNPTTGDAQRATAAVTENIVDAIPVATSTPTSTPTPASIDLAAAAATITEASSKNHKESKRTQPAPTTKPKPSNTAMGKIGLRLSSSATKKTEHRHRLPLDASLFELDSQSKEAEHSTGSSSISAHAASTASASSLTTQYLSISQHKPTIDAHAKQVSQNMLLANETKPASGTFAANTSSVAQSFSASRMSTTTTTTSTRTSIKKGRNTKNNDNFVPLNLRNSAGACRGARNVNKRKELRKQRQQAWRQEKEREWAERAGQTAGDGVSSNPYSQQRTSFAATASARNDQINHVCRMTGLDPVDNYLDGIFQAPSASTPASAPTSMDRNSKSNGSKGSRKPASAKANKGKAPPTDKAQSSTKPSCARHRLPCKLLVVKKNTTGNKGRKFYVCSMPKGQQCNHFQWADDTIGAVQTKLLKNKSISGFISRQVKSHTDRYRMLTVPELKMEAKKKGLSHVGTKSQLLMRLSIWVRDEVALSKTVKGSEENDMDTANGVPDPPPPESNPSEMIELDDDSVSTSDSDSQSSEDVDDDDDDEEDLLLIEKGDSSDDALNAHGRTNVRKERNRNSTTECTSKGSEGIALDHDDSYDDNNDASIDDELGTAEYRHALRDYFGHNNFRDGQEWAIDRCMHQQRTLLVAPTGFGKSLCYALPAALLDGVTIVVSPLLSLIQDQMRSLPPRIPAATLSGSLSASETAAIIDDIVRKRVKILFISPERLVSASFRRLFQYRWDPKTKTRRRTFPEIPLLCLDEAHCASQWAHNFRPCFLRFRHFLNLLSPKSVLAITATAEPRVVDDICKTIRIADGDDQGQEGIRIMKTDRDNIDISSCFYSSHEERLSMLVDILSPAKLQKNKKNKTSATPSGNSATASLNGEMSLPGSLATGSVIVYVWRQKDTEVVAEYLQTADVQGGIVFYHGGMTSTARTKSQSQFMRGKARICVATVAFGMGIDKADIVGVIHVTLPSSPEHYLQEIGRAGRNGKPAKAIALPLHEEVAVKHSLAHTDAICRSQILCVLQALRRRVHTAVIDCCEDGDFTKAPRALNISIPIEATAIACDCKSETIETILSLIEQHGETMLNRDTVLDNSHSSVDGNGDDIPFLHVEGVTSNAATIAMKKRSLEVLSKTEDVANIIRLCGKCVVNPIGQKQANLTQHDADGQGRQRGSDRSTSSTEVVSSDFDKSFLAYSHGAYTFSIIDCANRLGPNAEPRHIFAALRRLQNQGELELSLDTSAKGRAFHLKLTASGVEAFDFKSIDDGGIARNSAGTGTGTAASNVSHTTAGAAQACGPLDTMATTLEALFVNSMQSTSSKVLSIHGILNDVAKVDSCTSTAAAATAAAEAVTALVTGACDAQTHKSARLRRFQELTTEYFSAAGLRCDDPAAVNDELFGKLPKHELFSDVDHLLRELPDMGNHARQVQNPIDAGVVVGRPHEADYTVLAMTKMLHGIETPRLPMRFFRSHPLFGKYRNVQFEHVRGSIRKMMSQQR